VAALALADDGIDLDELERRTPDRLALVLGTEGDGLSRAALAVADLRVRIPMLHGVDSLNVAAAAAVALWATRVR
jgi:tRNA G18 (ribose-2'-O)-methylase SpoU